MTTESNKDQRTVHVKVSGTCPELLRALSAKKMTHILTHTTCTVIGVLYCSTLPAKQLDQSDQLSPSPSLPPLSTFHASIHPNHKQTTLWWIVFHSCEHLPH